MGKRESLRAGESVELEPGIHGRLNPSNRTLELSNGKVLPISKNDQRDLFPENEQALDIARRKEKLEGQIKEVPGGEFFHQVGQSGLIGAAQDWLNKFTKQPEEYANQKQAQAEVSGRISGESPYKSAAATATSFVPDVLLTGGMRAAVAAPLLTAASAGPRILEEPGQVALESGAALGGGFLLDKATNFLNKTAARRAMSREVPIQQANVRAQNISGKQGVEQANLQANQSYNALKGNIKTANETILKNHEIALDARKAKMLQDKQAFEAAQSSRNAEVFRLEAQAKADKATRSGNIVQSENAWRTEKAAVENEIKSLKEAAKASEAQYKMALEELPAMQKRAQQEYSANVIKNAETIQNAFPKQSRIYTSQIGVNDFIDESIKKSGLAGSREGNQASKIIRSIFPEGEILTGNDLSKRYRAIEEAIQASSPEVRQVLTGFKGYMGEKLPSILADNIAYTRIVPTLTKQLQAEAERVINSMSIAESGLGSKSLLRKRAADNIKAMFRELPQERFLEKLNSGEISQTLKQGVLTPRDFSFSIVAPKVAKRAKSAGMTGDLHRFEASGLNIVDPVAQRFNDFVATIGNRIDTVLGRTQTKAMVAEIDAAKKLGNKISGTLGAAEPIPAPQPPQAPQLPSIPAQPEIPPPIAAPTLPPPITPPGTPAIPPRPQLQAPPVPPQPQTYSPIAEPLLPQASGIAERLGDTLESGVMGGKGLVNNPLTKLAGLKYLLGKAALPAEAAYLGVKGLTAPGAAGEVARASFRSSGIAAIEQMAQKYPSYQNGILQNPQDRRSLCREVEDDQEIPKQQKAIIQSKINRGTPLQERLI